MTLNPGDANSPGEEQPLRAAGWYPDPTSRFELRFWDGSFWRNWVIPKGAEQSQFDSQGSPEGAPPPLPSHAAGSTERFGGSEPRSPDAPPRGVPAAVGASSSVAGMPVHSTWLSATGRRARWAASVVEVVAWISLGIGVLTGLGLALTTREESCEGFVECGSTHPYVAEGLGLAVLSAVQSLFIVMIAAYVQFRTEVRDRF